MSEKSYINLGIGADPKKIVPLCWTEVTPTLGQKVRFDKGGEDIPWKKVNDLTPIGKFGLDDYFQRAGQDLANFKRSMNLKQIFLLKN